MVINFSLAQTCPPKTEVRGTNAYFVGEVTDTGGDITHAWFEYGTTLALGYKTVARIFTKPSLYCSYVFGLKPCTTYYYRAVAQNSAGTSYGEIKSFTTTCQKISIISKPVYQNIQKPQSTFISPKCNLEITALVKDLSKEGEYVNSITITPNTKISVLISVKSKTGFFENVNLQVTIPNQLKFQNNFITIDNIKRPIILSDLVNGINLGNIGPNEEKVVTFELLTTSKDNFDIGTNTLKILAKIRYGNVTISDDAYILVNVTRSINFNTSSIVDYVPIFFILALILFFFVVILFIIFLYLRIKKLMT